MESSDKTAVTVEVTVTKPVEKVWEAWTNPQHITQWNHASDDWHTPYAENDLQPGGQFLWRMEARDGSFGFDFTGTYNEVIVNKLITITLGDDRKVSIAFTGNGNHTHIVETFEPEDQNPVELQRDGWQAILNNFKKYAEGH